MIRYLNQDHANIAWSYFLIQFQNSPILESFVKSLYRPIQDLQTALKDLMDKRTLAKASGQQLDGIGDIVGVKRPFLYKANGVYFGFLETSEASGFNQASFVDSSDTHSIKVAQALNDEDYRRLIYFKIAINNGHGTLQEIYEAMRLVFNASQVIIEEQGNAKIKIYFDQKSAPTFILENAKAYIPTAAGVGVELYGDLAKGYFGFEGSLNSKGLDQAPFIDVDNIIK